MNPSSAIALVSAMPGLCCSVFSALEMASLLAAQQTNKTATPAAAIAPLCNTRLVFFIDPMECPSSPTALAEPPFEHCQIVLRSDNWTLVQCACLLTHPRRGRNATQVWITCPI